MINGRNDEVVRNNPVPVIDASKFQGEVVVDVSECDQVVRKRLEPTIGYREPRSNEQTSRQLWMIEESLTIGPPRASSSPCLSPTLLCFGAIRFRDLEVVERNKAVAYRTTIHARLPILPRDQVVWHRTL